MGPAEKNSTLTRIAGPDIYKGAQNDSGFSENSKMHF